MKKIYVFTTLILLSAGCMTSNRMDRMEQSMEKVPVDNIRDEQTDATDRYTFIAFHAPAFGTWDITNKPDISKAGLTIGNWRNKSVSFDVSYLYSLGNQSIKKLQSDDAKQVEMLGRHDLKALASIPLFSIPCRDLRRPFLVREAGGINYLMFQELKFQTKINLNVGFENRYNLHGTHNDGLYPGKFDRTNVTQVTQDVRLGLSLTRRVNYKYIIDMSGLEVQGRYMLAHEFIAAYRLMIGNKVSDIKYVNWEYDNVTNTSHSVTTRKNPKDYLKKNIGGLDLTYRVHFGRFGKALLTSDFSFGTYTGYFDKTMDRFYFRLRFAVGIAFYKPKMSWE